MVGVSHRSFASPFRRIAPVLTLVSWVALSACSSVLQPVAGVTSFDQPFDLARPPQCDHVFEPPGDDEVEIVHLGTAGLYVGWRGTALLAGPFFSNPSLLGSQVERIRPRHGAIARALFRLPSERVAAIIVGHSHYDHLADVPTIALRHARRARLYVNRTGARALAPFRGLRGRIETVEDLPATGLILTDAVGNLQPIRLRAFASDHAPQIGSICWNSGEISESWSDATGDWSRRRWRHLPAGTTHAFLIELLERTPTGPDDQPDVVYRIYYQDSANRAGTGLPVASATPVAVDLAVLCIASHQNAPGHPEHLLEALAPRHVLVSHWDDFFRSTWRPRRLVPLLGERRANAFLSRLIEGVPAGQRDAGPLGQPCSPSSAAWTLPLPGESLRFRVRGSP